MPDVHDHSITDFLPAAPFTDHPSWCSPRHCSVHDDGVRVHEQELVRWEDAELRFESRLFFPDGELPSVTYLQLSIHNLRLMWRCIDAFLPISAARRLRDQLTAHLDAADSYPSRARPKAADMPATVTET